MIRTNVRLPQLRSTALRRAKDGMHAFQSTAAKLWGRPGAGMLTDLKLDGRPVIFVHNPKAGGTSLGKFLHVKRRSHAFPVDRLRENAWCNAYVIVVVRHPVDRFLSGYYDHVLKNRHNGLVKKYGEAVWKLGLLGYLELLDENPKYGGSQLHWACYPSERKPFADIILRFEEITLWKDRLLEIGLDVGSRELPATNRSGNSDKDHLRKLGLDKQEFDAAIAHVQQYFSADFETFGYARY